MLGMKKVGNMRLTREATHAYYGISIIMDCQAIVSLLS
jgi:hypothetical protein